MTELDLKCVLGLVAIAVFATMRWLWMRLN